jgi:CDP-diacylglycerol--serine O-phosphatidyltransferase
LSGTPSISFPRLRFLIVNGFTGFNLFIGVLALLGAGTGHSVLAAWALLLCVLLDSCDGSLARRWRVTSEFGAQLDSLADMTSFILAGVGLIYSWARPATPFWPTLLICGVYALAGAVRLARFNTTPRDSSYFQGIPTTGGGAVLAALYLAAPPPSSYGVVALAGLLAALMVSTLPYPKLTTLLRAPAWVWLGVLASVCVSLRGTIWLLVACYFCVGPAIWVYRRLRRNLPGSL